MRRLAVICTSAALFGLAFTGALWKSQTLAKTKGGCKDTQVCCRYLKDGTTELDCMDAKACKDNDGKEIPDKTKCAE